MTNTYDNAELDLESRMGGLGTETLDRAVPVIDLNNWDLSEADWETKAEELWEAATTIGFFQLKNFGISREEIETAFAESARFFELEKDVLSQIEKVPGVNAGWEYKSQVRPSTGTPDEKESFQVTRPLMADLWPEEEAIPGFRDAALDFESKCHAVAMKVLACFGWKLGFPQEYFSEAHKPESDQHQSTLRLLHYLAVDAKNNVPNPDGSPIWRAGAHTDFNCLTLLFQSDGQDGLQVLPGSEAEKQAWTPVPAFTDVVTCNIGDMLMRWSDDKLKSNFHRVKSPAAGQDIPERYTIAYFAQADRDAVIEGLEKKYEPMTAGDYLDMRINANFSGKK